MTFGAFKTLVRANTIGELSLPSDDVIVKELLLAAIVTDIAGFVTPTTLLEQDREKAEMLYSFPNTDKFFIRKPTAPTDDSSEIDLDDELCYAAVYFVSERFVKDAAELNKKEKMKKKADEVLQNYLWRFAEYLESKGICDDLSR